LSPSIILLIRGRPGYYYNQPFSGLLINSIRDNLSLIITFIFICSIFNIVYRKNFFLGLDFFLFFGGDEKVKKTPLKIGSKRGDFILLYRLARQRLI